MSNIKRIDAGEQSDSLTEKQQRSIRHAKRVVANAIGVEADAVRIGVTF
jgi:lambda repressor-like predicted transcriptional regulator